MEINWDVTSYCNLRCKHCGAINLLNETEKISCEERMIIADNISKFSDSVILVGGEPTIVPKLTSLLDVFEKENISVNMITNGQSPINKYEDILEYHIGNITVSIDGNESENDIIRGLGTWEKAMQCVQYLSHKKSDKKLKSLGINIVINKINNKSILQLLELIDMSLVDIIQISAVSYIGNAQKNKSELYLDEDELINTYLAISKYAVERGLCDIIQIQTGNCYIDELLLLETGYRVSNNRKCGALLESAYVDVNGILYPCRTYKGEGVDLKNKNVDYETILQKFHEFIASQEEIIGYEPNVNCKHYMSCNYCPLSATKCTGLCTVAHEKLISAALGREWKNVDKVFFYENENQYFGYYLSNLEKVEYTIEGYLIHKALKQASSIEEIAKLTSYPETIVSDFLMSEFWEGRVK